jgi:hypothetical protein
MFQMTIACPVVGNAVRWFTLPCSHCGIPLGPFHRRADAEEKAVPAQPAIEPRALHDPSDRSFDIGNLDGQALFLVFVQDFVQGGIFLPIPVARNPGADQFGPYLSPKFGVD